MFWKREIKESISEKKLSQINDILKKSFTNVKRDTTNIFQWLNYFYRKDAEQEQRLKQIQAELSYAPKTREDIKRIIDYYYPFDELMSKMRQLGSKIDELERRHAVSYERHAQPLPKEQLDLSYIEKRLDRLEQRKLSMKEKIVKRLTRNSKDYVKSIILSYIRKYEKISALQLKEIVVDEQHFCSKSSFYRFLEEIEELDEIGVIKQGKEKHYISKAVKRL